MGASSGSKGVVLVVEDEPLVRMVAAATIEDAGFETIEAVGAESAIAILEDPQGYPDSLRRYPYAGIDGRP